MKNKKQANKQVAKKTIILYILKMLNEGSSQQQPIHYSAMARTLNHVGVNCDRKTVSRNIGYLIDYGYNIKKTKQGVYLDNGFCKSEVLMLVDFLRSSCATNNQLEDKLIDLLNYKDKQEVKNILICQKRRV